MRRRRRRHHPRPLGLRGRAVRRRRHLRLVRQRRPSRRRTPQEAADRGDRPPRAPHRAGRSPAVGAARPASPWTGTAATGRSSSTTSSAASWSGRPWPPGPRTSTAPCSRRRRSAPGSSWRRSTAPACPSRSSSWPAGLLKNPLLMQIYADVLGLPLSAIVVRAGSGARLGDPRRGGRRRLPRHPQPRRPWAVGAGASSRPIPTNVAAYDELFAEYQALHDHFGRGANDVMRRLKPIRRAALA